jgi:hypothetical protein
MALPAIIGPAMAAAGKAGGTAAAGSAVGGAAGAMGGASRAIAMLGQAQGAINQLGSAARQSASLVSGLAGMITGQMVKAMTGLLGIVKSAADPIEHLVRLFNPAKADVFVRAMTDAFAVVGRMLTPVLDAFTGVARKVGDLMAGMEPVLAPAMAAIAELVKVIGDEVVKTIRDNMPFFEMLAAVITKVAQAAATAVQILGEAIRAFNRMFGGRIARMLGFDGSSFDPKASSVGAAARQARFQAPKELSNDAIKNALQIGKEGVKAKKPEERSADALEKIQGWLERNTGGLLGLIGGGGKDEKGKGSPTGGLTDRLGGNLGALRLLRQLASAT